ncbi:MAG: hypothetical protein GWM98_17830 [Nitrospinaceae bacterium]|nr:hypothetical protein [Nitrospinaceae bacterium]NIR57729.1 hypothetical protein [Nitrospinaceae bacterium]NIS88189.1 hypothetical protein [Nitrospinaceae bacterium]NIT83288.1 hypothetical protein [Nitrospinaceae bacterium]NIU47227.1 hypothetical protein [Nitrospinaceae bacterium]
MAYDSSGRGRFHPTNVKRFFENVRDADEELIWGGGSEFVPFVISGIPFLIFGIGWGAFDYFGFLQHADFKKEGGFLIPFFLIHLTPFWLAIGNQIRLFLVHGNTFYAITNKRVLLRSGFWGTDFGPLTTIPFLIPR